MPDSHRPQGKEFLKAVHLIVETIFPETLCYFVRPYFINLWPPFPQNKRLWEWIFVYSIEKQRVRDSTLPWVNQYVWLIIKKKNFLTLYLVAEVYVYTSFTEYSHLIFLVLNWPILESSYSNASTSIEGKTKFVMPLPVFYLHIKEILNLQRKF